MAYLHPAEMRSLIALSIYQCDQGHTIAWTVATALGKQTPLWNLLNPQAINLGAENYYLLDSKTSDLRKKPFIQKYRADIFLFFVGLFTFLFLFVLHWFLRFEEFSFLSFSF